MKELLTIAAMVALSLLIVFKSDQQSIIILKGKVFRHQKKQEFAEKIYRNHTRLSSVLLFSAGMAFLALSVIFFANENSLFPITGIIGLLLSGCGIWGRLKSFRAADRELDEVVSGHHRSTS